MVKGGYSVANKALVDTGANSVAFIDTNFALLIAKHSGLNTIRLGMRRCGVSTPWNHLYLSSYDTKAEAPITDVLPVTLLVDGRK
jgi:hypothetical protein